MFYEAHLFKLIFMGSYELGLKIINVLDYFHDMSLYYFIGLFVLSIIVAIVNSVKRENQLGELVPHTNVPSRLSIVEYLYLVGKKNKISGFNKIRFFTDQFFSDFEDYNSIYDGFKSKDIICKYAYEDSIVYKVLLNDYIGSFISTKVYEILMGYKLAKEHGVKKKLRKGSFKLSFFSMIIAIASSLLFINMLEIGMLRDIKVFEYFIFIPVFIGVILLIVGVIPVFLFSIKPLVFVFDVIGISLVVFVVHYYYENFNFVIKETGVFLLFISIIMMTYYWRGKYRTNAITYIKECEEFLLGVSKMSLEDIKNRMALEVNYLYDAINLILVLRGEKWLIEECQWAKEIIEENEEYIRQYENEEEEWQLLHGDEDDEYEDGEEYEDDEEYENESCYESAQDEQLSLIIGVYLANLKEELEAKKDKVEEHDEIAEEA